MPQYGTDHMHPADAMDALERTRGRLEKAYNEAIRAIARFNADDTWEGGKALGAAKVERGELEEELTAVAVALDVLKLVRS